MTCDVPTVRLFLGLLIVSSVRCHGILVPPCFLKPDQSWLSLTSDNLWFLFVVKGLRYLPESLDGAGERTQWLRAHTSFVESTSWVSRTHIMWLTTTCNSSYSAPNFPFWPLQAAVLTCTDPLTEVNTSLETGNTAAPVIFLLRRSSSSGSGWKGAASLRMQPAPWIQTCLVTLAHWANFAKHYV